MEKKIDENQEDNIKYWKKWYIALFLWLLVLIILFYLFTKKYA